MVTVASTVIDFGEQDAAGESGLIKIELDDELNATGSDDGESAADFYPGAEIYFLVHSEDSITIESIKSTSGSVVMLGMVTRERAVELLFTGEESAQDLEYFPAGELSVTWYGNAPDLTLDNRTVTAAGALPAYGAITFPVNFLSCKLSAPAAVEFNENGEYPIQIVARYSAK